MDYYFNGVCLRFFARRGLFLRATLGIGAESAPRIILSNSLLFMRNSSSAAFIYTRPFCARYLK